MTSPDLEPILDRALKALPPPRAPHTLLPAVMAAARAAEQRPWYARPWSDWPRQWQAASAAALALLVAGGAVLLPMILPLIAPVMAVAGDLLRPAGEWMSDIAVLMTAAESVGRTLRQSIVGIGLALFTGVFMVMLAMSVAVGAAIGRVALGGVHR